MHVGQVSSMGGRSRTAAGWAAFAAVAVLLYLVARESYVVFHTLAELFAVTVAFAAFAIAWFSRGWITRGPLLFIGIGQLFIALTDLAHMLAYKGMNVLPNPSGTLASQIWIAGRYLEAATFLLALSPVAGRAPVASVWVGFAGVTALLLASIAAGWFPVTYVEGAGLTPFKIASEYVISGLFVVALLMLRRAGDAFDPVILRLLGVALATKVVDELLFTFYIDVYGISNYVGHIGKIVSYVCFFQAVVATGLIRPQALIFGALEREKHLTGEVRRQAATLDAVLGATVDAVAMVDGQGRFRFVGKAAEALFGKAAADLVGRRWDEAGLPAPVMQPVERACREVLAGAGPASVELQAGGRWLECKISPVVDAGSAVGPAPQAVVVAARDITARKAMEEELKASLADNRALLVEVHHRVKNNLQIVSSILQMQGWRIDDARLREEFDEACGRILSLAKVHELVYSQDSFASVDFVSYVHVLCDELLRLYGVREDQLALDIDAGNLPLGIERAVPLALILHELVNHAIKHAFADPGARLTIRIGPDGEPPGGGPRRGGRLVVGHDRADPAALSPDHPSASLGMRMVGVLVRQIEGGARVEAGQGGGAVVTVTFPLGAPPAEAPATPSGAGPNTFA